MEEWAGRYKPGLLTSAQRAITFKEDKDGLSVVAIGIKRAIDEFMVRSYSSRKISLTCQWTRSAEALKYNCR